MLLRFWEVPVSNTVSICTLQTNVYRNFSLSVPTYVRRDCSLNNISTGSCRVFHTLSFTGHAVNGCLSLNGIKVRQLFLANVLHVFPDVQLYLRYLHIHFTINCLLIGSD
jgi:hypothetical protein